MTIKQFSARLKAIEAAKIATSAIDENEEVIKTCVCGSWDEGKNPSGEYLKAMWYGGETSEEYRQNWNVKKIMYNYRTLNISGETRANLRVNSAKLFSGVNYWHKILSNFEAANQNPISFLKVSKNNYVKEAVALSFRKLWMSL